MPITTLPDAIQLRDFAYGSEAYQASLTLRSVILRQPLGLSLSDADLAGEAEQFHCGAFAHGFLLGSLVLKPLSKHWRLRQMAIAARHRGIGTALLDFAEQFTRQHRCRYLELHARVSAREFYHQRGYQCDSQEFTEVGVPHCRMWKTLA